MPVLRKSKNCNEKQKNYIFNVLIQTKKNRLYNWEGKCARKPFSLLPKK